MSLDKLEKFLNDNAAVSGYENLDGAGRVHDWRNHVPNHIKEIWNELPFTAKCVAFDLANRLASAEEWE